MFEENSMHFSGLFVPESARWLNDSQFAESLHSCAQSATVECEPVCITMRLAEAGLPLKPTCGPRNTSAMHSTEVVVVVSVAVVVVGLMVVVVTVVTVVAVVVVVVVVLAVVVVVVLSVVVLVDDVVV